MNIRAACVCVCARARVHMLAFVSTFVSSVDECADIIIANPDYSWYLNNG